MPIYEYRCTKGHVFDVMQRFSDDPLNACQVCAAPAQRVMHAPAVHFKGSGFYNTDYGTRKRSRENEAHESARAEAGKAEGGKADGKSESGNSDKSAKSDGSSGDKKETKTSSDSKRTETKAKTRTEG